MDQAGWHRAKDLVIPANITAVSLPPYSPELNPVERVWLHLRERFLSHRWLEDYDAIVQAAYVHETDRHFHQSGHLRFNHSRHFARATAGPAPWGGPAVGV